VLGVHCEGVVGYHRFLLVKLFQPLDDGASTWYAQLRSSALTKSSVQDVRAVRTSAEPSPVRLFSLLNMGYIWQNHRREPDGDASIPRFVLILTCSRRYGGPTLHMRCGVLVEYKVCMPSFAGCMRPYDGFLRLVARRSITH